MTIVDRDNQNINDLRLTEINTYYSQKYNAYYGVFLKIIITCVILVVIAVLRQRYLINSRIANILAGIILIIGLFFIIPSVFNIFTRNNLVFDEYDFQIPGDLPEGTGEDGKDIADNLLKDLNKYRQDLNKYSQDIKLLAEGTCLGPSCCEGTGLTYDNKNKQCVSVSSSDHESFISGQSTQHPGASLSESSTISKQLIQTDPSGKYYSID